jgi:hypothetical protein
MQEALEAIKVNLAVVPRPRKAIPTIRSNIWCHRCGDAGHYPSECPRFTHRRVQFVDQDEVAYWGEEEEEEGVQPVYQVLPAQGKGRVTPSSFRPIAPPFRQTTVGASQPTAPRYQLYTERNYGCCFNCGSPDHYANVCPYPKASGQGAPLQLPCQNCHQYGHGASTCTQPLQPRPTYKPVETPPREQTALNYGHDKGVENPAK